MGNPVKFFKKRFLSLMYLNNQLMSKKPFQQHFGVEFWKNPSETARIFRVSVCTIYPALLLGDFKRFTSKAVVKAIQENPKESRKEFFLSILKKPEQKFPM
jgi:hypothetical protein